eukprot:6362874-Ditylum_brightwellii.AAC.1
MAEKAKKQKIAEKETQQKAKAKAKKQKMAENAVQKKEKEEAKKWKMTEKVSAVNPQKRQRKATGK